MNLIRVAANSSMVSPIIKNNEFEIELVLQFVIFVFSNKIFSSKSRLNEAIISEWKSNNVDAIFNDDMTLSINKPELFKNVVDEIKISDESSKHKIPIQLLLENKSDSELLTKLQFSKIV